MSLPGRLKKILDAEIERHHLQAAREQIHADSRECFYLHVTDESDLALGRSRMGGFPDLPAGTQWPAAHDGERYAFLMQLNLGELPEVTHELPRTGMLYFFAQFEDLPHPSRVIYAPDARGLVAITPPKTDDDRRSFRGPCYYGDTKPHGIKILHGVEPPPYWSDTAQAAMETCPDVGGLKAYERYEEFTSACNLTAGEKERLAGKLLGRAEQYGGGDLPSWIAAARALGIYDLLGDEEQTLEEFDRHSEAALKYVSGESNIERWREQNAKRREHLMWYRSHQQEFADERRQWRLLWQIQSNFRVGLNICDAGEWNILIRDSDLQRRNFDNVVALPQGH
jgi:uncharacterized protein YwqG